jgi:hypothetical protein
MSSFDLAVSMPSRCRDCGSGWGPRAREFGDLWFDWGQDRGLKCKGHGSWGLAQRQARSRSPGRIRETGHRARWTILPVRKSEGKQIEAERDFPVDHFPSDHFPRTQSLQLCDIALHTPHVQDAGVRFEELFCI